MDISWVVTNQMLARSGYVSAGLHWLHERWLVPGITAGTLIDATLAAGRLAPRPLASPSAR